MNRETCGAAAHACSHDTMCGHGAHEDSYKKQQGRSPQNLDPIWFPHCPAWICSSKDQGQRQTPQKRAAENSNLTMHDGTSGAE